MALNFKQQLKQLRLSRSQAMFHSQQNVLSLLVHMVLCSSDIRTAWEKGGEKTILPLILNLSFTAWCLN